MIATLVASLLVTGCEEREADLGSAKIYQRHGIFFSYPGNWKISEESNEIGIRYVFVETPGNAIAIIQLFPLEVAQTLNQYSRDYASAAAEATAIGKISVSKFQDLGMKNGYARIKETFSITLLGEEVPHVRTHWSKDVAGSRGFIICQAATEDLPKVEAGFGLLAESLKWEAAEGVAKQKPDATHEEKLVFKTEWGGERLDLPTDFAPEMKLEGVEEIRFAPGMFKPDDDSFFSYVFVFAVSADQELTGKVIKEEMLTYYRGLAESVSKGAIDGKGFKFEMEKAKEAKGAPSTVADLKKVAQYSGKLDWIEPFATKKAQVLHFELQSWSDAATVRNYLFVCTSPKKPDGKSEIWKEMRRIRSDFVVRGEAKK
jgi:hypothetical protein